MPSASSPFASPRQPDSPHRSRTLKRALIGVAVLLALAMGGFGLYVSDYYHASASVTALERSLERTGVDHVAYAEDDARIAVGDPASERGLVLYPGAKVEARAYLPLALELADRGVYCAIAKMPLNLAFSDINAADALMAEAPRVKTWWIGGHSLGGAMAAQYAAGHAGGLAGIALLGAYAASDLSGTSLSALVVYGSEDGVLNRDKLAASAGNLPVGATTRVIEGGNHAGFGAYGPQDGDGTASIPAEEQQAQAADAILAAMEG